MQFLGKFYLANAGFIMKYGIILPYRGVYYHMKEYSRNPPRNMQKLFNLQYASLHNAIEKAFGILKKRFSIIASADEPFFGIEIHKQIFIACSILYNYLMSVDLDERLISEVDEELNNQHLEPKLISEPFDDVEDEHREEEIRNSIVAAMWMDYTI